MRRIDFAPSTQEMISSTSTPSWYIWFSVWFSSSSFMLRISTLAPIVSRQSFFTSMLWKCASSKNTIPSGLPTRYAATCSFVKLSRSFKSSGFSSALKLDSTLLLTKEAFCSIQRKYGFENGTNSFTVIFVIISRLEHGMTISCAPKHILSPFLNWMIK